MFSTAEKIETVTECRASGVFGDYVALADGSARVTVEGRTYIVRSVAAGWCVSFGPYDHVDPSLLEAARLAVWTADASRGRMGASRNYQI